MSEDLKLACENLSLQDKVELREYLSDMINSSRSVSQSPLRCSILMGEMAKVMGKESIGYLSREADEVWARTMVAFQMCKEGYSTTEVGRQMMKDHSTIIHLRNKMQDVFELPQMYGDILEIWNRFQKQYKMTFTKEQLKTLSAWEENFRTAVNAKWARNPGRSGLRVIYDIYTSATGDRRRFSDNCSTCILNLLTDCGKLYFEDTLSAAVDNLPTKEVKVSQEAKETVRKAKVKTTKKSK